MYLRRKEEAEFKNQANMRSKEPPYHKISTSKAGVAPLGIGRAISSSELHLEHAKIKYLQAMEHAERWMQKQENNRKISLLKEEKAQRQAKRRSEHIPFAEEQAELCKDSESVINFSKATECMANEGTLRSRYQSHMSNPIDQVPQKSYLEQTLQDLEKEGMRGHTYRQSNHLSESSSDSSSRPPHE